MVRQVKRISWVRSIDWCNRHDIPWASHADLGIWIESDCRRLEHWVEDVEKVQKRGLPRCPGETP